MPWHGTHALDDCVKVIPSLHIFPLFDYQLIRLARKPWLAFWFFAIKDRLGSAYDAIADEASALFGVVGEATRGSKSIPDS